MLAKARRCRIDRATTNIYQRRPPSSTRSTLAVTGAGRAESIMFIPQLGQQSTSVERMNACQCQVTSTAMGSVRGTGVCKRCNGSGESTGKLVQLPGYSTYSCHGRGRGIASCGISELAVVVHSNDRNPNDRPIPIPTRQENPRPTGKVCK